MSTTTTHKTLLGNFIHEAGVFLHNFHIGPINASNMQQLIVEGVAVGNVINEVKNDVKGITDPAALTKAVAQSLINREKELPTSLQGSAFVEETIKIAGEIEGLPLDAVEAEIKSLLAQKSVETIAP